MCNCIETTLESESIGKYLDKKFPGKNIVTKGWKEKLWSLGGNLDTHLFNTINVEISGRKKLEPITIIHTYCPFCGVKHENLEN